MATAACIAPEACCVLIAKFGLNVWQGKPGPTGRKKLSKIFNTILSEINKQGFADKEGTLMWQVFSVSLEVKCINEADCPVVPEAVTNCKPDSVHAFCLHHVVMALLRLCNCNAPSFHLSSH